MADHATLFDTAQAYIAGGVNSPVRAFKGVGGTPVFFAAGEGPYLIDTEGKRYIDYVLSWGPLLLGHAHPHVVKAVQEAVARGLGFGAPTVLETQLAQKVQQLMPTMESMRFVNSGTEATMSAIRVARGFTGRNKIIKFTGCYHGHNDALLVQAGSGILTLGIPSSAGVPASFTEHTLVADFNDLGSVETLFNQYGDDIAAIILEPVAGNMNCVPPIPGFLPGLRALCDKFGALLIFDEVMTGFRVALGGAQAHYDIKPDLTTLGKVIGGGMPVGAFGGRHDVMQCLAPTGAVYQAGTLSGNPIAMTAGLTMLELISEPDFQQRINDTTQQLVTGLLERAQRTNIPLTCNSAGSMFGFFFSKEPSITTYQQVMACDQARFKRFFHGMLEHGVYLAPSAFETGFMSALHGPDEIEATLNAAENVFKTL